MKKMYLVLFSSLGLMLYSCGNSESSDANEKTTESKEVKKDKDNVIAFNDMIVKDHELIIMAEDKLVFAIEEPLSNEEVDAIYNELLELTENTLNKYENMAPFDDEDEFRLAAVDYFKSFDHFVKEKVPSLIEYHHKGFDDLSDEELDTFFDRVDHFFDDIEAQFDKVLAAQQEFAKKYNFDVG